MGSTEEWFRVEKDFEFCRVEEAVVTEERERGAHRETQKENVSPKLWLRK